MTFVAVAGGGQPRRRMGNALPGLRPRCGGRMIPHFATRWLRCGRRRIDWACSPAPSRDRLRSRPTPPTSRRPRSSTSSAGDAPRGAGLVATRGDCARLLPHPPAPAGGGRRSARRRARRVLSLARHGSRSARRSGAHERWQLGEGLVQLTDGDPDALIAVMRSLRATGQRRRGGARPPREPCASPPARAAVAARRRRCRAAGAVPHAGRARLGRLQRRT